MFTGHKYITDKSQETGFQQYLLIDTDYQVEAYGFDDNTQMDLESMLNEIYGMEHDVALQRPSLCGPNYAAIITDGRTPDSVIVWESADFYLD